MLSVTNNLLPRGKIKDARAWLSAALINQQGCVGGFKKINDTVEVGKTMTFLDHLVSLTSNALSMVLSYDVYGNDTKLWVPPRTERDGFWEPFASGSGGALNLVNVFPPKEKANVTVCKDGSNGCFKTVQEGVNAAPNNIWGQKFVVYIKEGIYDEIVRVPLEKTNVVFLGDGMGKTVITGALKVGPPGVTTFATATVGVMGDGFMASGITFQNSAGVPTTQAVAFRSDSDFSFVENCEFIGHQDTLYVHSLRQYYKSCRILGNVDFIFGNGAAVFEDCELLVNPRQETPEAGESNAVTAQSRTDPAQSTGFVFQNCSINGTEEYMKLYNANPKKHKNYLGRPWQEYSRVVFINCNFGALIHPEGWMPWKDDLGLNTLYYGEFGNSGPGSDVSQRVTWSSRIPSENVNKYSLQNFVQGMNGFQPPIAFQDTVPPALKSSIPNLDKF